MTGDDSAAFLRAAVEYANNKCWGTLACRCAATRTFYSHWVSAMLACVCARVVMALRVLSHGTSPIFAIVPRSVFIHPATQREHAAAWDAALEALRYGSINVNAPAVCGFAATPLVWGAFPGNTPQDIGSGDSYVHNTFLFDHPEKSVCAAPWTYAPQPLWSVFQVGLQSATPHAMRYIANQHRPLVALFYLIQVG